LPSLFNLHLPSSDSRHPFYSIILSSRYDICSEWVIDRKTLVGKHYAGMTIRSVGVEEEGEEVEGKGKGEGERSVKVMEYLDVAFI
jgi:hypothetical protein